MNTREPSNSPVLTDLNGNTNTKLSFKIDAGVHAYQSCGLQFKGEFYVYGSYEGDRRQIAKVTGCALKRVRTLPFSLYAGACAATTDRLFLCFDYAGDGKTCHVSNEPTGPFNSISKSIETHKNTRTATNESELIYWS